MKRFAILVVTVFTLAALAGGVDAAEKKGKGKGKGDHSPEALFKKLDANGDGKLTKDELANVAEQFKGKGKGEKKGAGDVFGKLDANGDGSLSLDEFKKVSAQRDRKKKN